MDQIEKTAWEKHQTELFVRGEADLVYEVEDILKKAHISPDSEEKTRRIRTLNDSLRIAGVGGQVVATWGIASSLPQETQQRVFEAIRSFNDFTEANDPYREHDCAILGDYMFKIDYFDKTLKYGSEKPESPLITKRVMTILTTFER